MSAARLSAPPGQAVPTGTPPRRVCLFAHYDPTHRIRPSVLHYLRALRDCGFETVVACSGDRLPPDGDIAALYETGASLFLRPNGGLDFAAWRDLMQEGYADGAEAVLLANDSVFGPYGDLTAIVARMRRRDLDAWGMVESRQSGWHLQSWFLHLNARALAAPAVRRVFDQPFETMSKEQVIRRGELALGAALRAEGLRCGAVHRHTDDSWFARLFPTNAMHIDWHRLVLSGEVPFVKVEVLRDNPMGIPWLRGWQATLRDRLGAPVEAIEDQLFSYTGRKRRPGAPFPTPFPGIGTGLSFRYVLLSRNHRLAWRALRSRLSQAPSEEELYGGLPSGT